MLDLNKFEKVLEKYLFLKAPGQLNKLDAKYLPGKTRDMTPSQLQRCLIDTAFALLQPKSNEIL